MMSNSYAVANSCAIFSDYATFLTVSNARVGLRLLLSSH